MVNRVERKYGEIKTAMKDLNKPLRSGISEPVTLSEAIAKSLCSGYFNNTCICNGSTIRAGFTQLTAKEKKSYVIHPSSVLTICDTFNSSTWVVYHEALSTSNNFLRIVTRIKAEWLQRQAPEWFNDTGYDVAQQSLKFIEEDLCIGSIRAGLFDDEQVFLKNLRKEFPQTVIFIPKQISSILPVQIASPPHEIEGVKLKLKKWKQKIMNQDTKDHCLESIFYQVTIGSGIVIKNAQQHDWRKLTFKVKLSRSIVEQELKKLDTIDYKTYATKDKETAGNIIVSSEESAKENNKILREIGILCDIKAVYIIVGNILKVKLGK